MRQSILYFAFGIIFLVIAINNARDSGTVWNVPTILLASIAALDFGMGIRFLKLHTDKKK